MSIEAALLLALFCYCWGHNVGRDTERRKQQVDDERGGS